jgi:site-specific recombinase XerD
MCPPEDSPPSTPADLLLDRYARYLREERGLAHATILNYRPLARLFLCEQFGDGELRLVELGPTAICSFLLGHAQSMSTGRAQLLVTTLRSLFRFLLRHGEIDVDLAAAVPPVRVGHRFVFAKHLPAADVEHLLDTCDLGVSTGLRNRAIFLLLARLGLRASEIVTLELDDIDWRAGEIAVSGKGRIRDRLPLVHEVGEAVAAYLLHGRPSSKSRRLFLRSRAPHRGFAGASTVSTLVRRALIRADLNPPRKGAHLLRHSLAMGMLDRGASMAEIGQLLRHRSATATEIYAHVDIRSLRSLAQPWPAIWSLR